MTHKRIVGIFTHQYALLSAVPRSSQLIMVIPSISSIVIRPYSSWTIMLPAMPTAWQGWFVPSTVEQLAIGENPFNAPSILSTASDMRYFQQFRDRWQSMMNILSISSIVLSYSLLLLDYYTPGFVCCPALPFCTFVSEALSYGESPV